MADDPDTVAARFGGTGGEPVTHGWSGAPLVRFRRGAETLYWKSGPEAAAEADRLGWLAGTGVPCPVVRDRGPDWVLTAELPGRDLARPWPESQRQAALAAMAEGLRVLHGLDAAGCPFVSPFPDQPATSRRVVTHGDYCCPNVLVDPATIRFAGVVDVGRLGVGDPYVDFALASMTLSGTLNPQYGGPPAARLVIESAGGDPDDPRIGTYIRLDQASG
jgi:kanamycin kinase